MRSVDLRRTLTSGRNLMFRLRKGDLWGAGAVASVAIGLVVALAGPAVARSDQAPTVVGSDPIAQELQAALDDVVAAGASGVTLRVDKTSEMNASSSV